MDAAPLATQHPANHNPGIYSPDVKRFYLSTMWDINLKHSQMLHRESSLILWFCPTLFALFRGRCEHISSKCRPFLKARRVCVV